MADGTVVVLAGDTHDDLRTELLERVTTAVVAHPVDGPEAALPTRLCAGIARLSPQPPLTIVAFGPTAVHLPAVALAQRAAHRRVIAYVLVEPGIPEVSDTWPDARVTVFADDPDPVAALRGWDVRPLAMLRNWAPDA